MAHRRLSRRRSAHRGNVSVRQCSRQTVRACAHRCLVGALWPDRSIAPLHSPVRSTLSIFHCSRRATAAYSPFLDSFASCSLPRPLTLSLLLIVSKGLFHSGSFRIIPFSDVISIAKTDENFRLLYDSKGRFTLHRITSEEAKVKRIRETGSCHEPRNLTVARSFRYS